MSVIKSVGKIILEDLPNVVATNVAKVDAKDEQKLKIVRIIWAIMLIGAILLGLYIAALAITTDIIIKQLDNLEYTGELDHDLNKQIINQYYQKFDIGGSLKYSKVIKRMDSQYKDYKKNNNNKQ